jgi:hypothetical protein
MTVAPPTTTAIPTITTAEPRITQPRAAFCDNHRMHTSHQWKRKRSGIPRKRVK